MKGFIGLGLITGNEYIAGSAFFISGGGGEGDVGGIAPLIVLGDLYR